MKDQPEISRDKHVVILRGIPGSGKTTLAKHYRDAKLREGFSVAICSADDYFMHGEAYLFNPKELDVAHSTCFDKFCKSIDENINHIIVDNTNIKPEHFERYVDLARKYGYTVEYITLGMSVFVDGSEADRAHYIMSCALRQRHNVPYEKIRSMFYELCCNVLKRYLKQAD